MSVDKNKKRVIQIKNYIGRKSRGQCTSCSNKAKENKTKCCRCLRKEKMRASKSRTKKIENRMCVACGAPMNRKGSRCLECTNKNRLRSIKYRQEVREEAISAYGGKCACCGELELEFLVLDHVNNDGSVHRKSLSGSGTGEIIYRWARRHNYPDNLQVLCANCNLGKLVGGVCPHQQTKVELRLVAK